MIDNKAPKTKSISRTECSCHEMRNRSNAPIGLSQNQNF